MNAEKAGEIFYKTVIWGMVISAHLILIFGLPQPKR